MSLVASACVRVVQRPLVVSVVAVLAVPSRVPVCSCILVPNWPTLSLNFNCVRVVVDSAAAVTVGTAATYTNVGATSETREVVAVSGIVSYQSVWAKLTPSTTRSYTITTAGSSFDTVLAVYSLSASAGVNVKNAVKVASNNDCSSGVKTSCVTVSLTSGTRYFFQIDGNAGATGTISFAIN